MKLNSQQVMGYEYKLSNKILIEKKNSANIPLRNDLESFDSNKDINKSVYQEDVINKLQVITEKIAIGDSNSLEISPIEINLNYIDNLVDKILHTEIYKKPINAQYSSQIMKDISNFHVDKDSQFIERMQFDVYKRQSKVKRLEIIFEKYKPKLDEKIRREAFNRLIKDANRRIESKDNIKALKELEERTKVSPKRYKTNEWLKIYNER